MAGNLYLMVGLSASGKSSIAREIAAGEDALIVSSDTIRGELSGGNCADQSRTNEVFRIFNQRIRDGLRAGRTVVADATELTMKARRSLLGGVNGLAKTVCACVVIKPVEDCIRDNPLRKYPVPEKVIRRQAEGFQIPFYEEGFDEIRIYRAFKGREAQLVSGPAMDRLSQMNVLAGSSQSRMDGFAENGQSRMDGFAENGQSRMDGFIEDCLQRMDGFDQKNPHHTMPLGEHCRFVADRFREKGYGDLFCKAALLHDIGKLFTQQMDAEGVAHYFSHDSVGAYYLLCHMPLEDFGSTEDLVEFLFLVNYHMLPFGWETEKTRSKWEQRLGTCKKKLLLDFHECDCACG
ncbi:MAG: AAA family ATPase [Lachnospiraceae bacterium]|nr:AAA family ATPase [Lachnospiraceae bacterium]